ncbi:hypothetical protein E2C01_002235 [Portunus trituberculatus]|uniref:Uncharacterized protein n=1 Tax=Portunus trituberculatus TaxID=210409 RepID=A0A5B7CJV3_PORTR|nr:hypothetical protein [Portunus trituberculatus]
MRWAMVGSSGSLCLERRRQRQQASHPFDSFFSVNLSVRPSHSLIFSPTLGQPEECLCQASLYSTPRLVGGRVVQPSTSSPRPTSGSEEVIRGPSQLKGKIDLSLGSVIGGGCVGSVTIVQEPLRDTVALHGLPHTPPASGSKPAKEKTERERKKSPFEMLIPL